MPLLSKCHTIVSRTLRLCLVGTYEDKNKKSVKMDNNLLLYILIIKVKDKKVDR